MHQISKQNASVSLQTLVVVHDAALQGLRHAVDAGRVLDAFNNFRIQFIYFLSIDSARRSQ